MSKKILCPFHQDHEPSMHVYEKFSYCFTCRASIPTSELNLPEHLRVLPKQESTNIKTQLEYIVNLPKKKIRGFNLHYDSFGAYILWPLGNFYKRRNWLGKVRYTAPTGTRQPLFVYPGDSSSLVLVEGEFNAMSLFYALDGSYKIASMGPASDAMRHIKYVLQFNSITIIMDNDASGVVFGYQLKERLLKEGKLCKLLLVDKDYNQVLQESGEEGVRVAFEREIA